MTAEIRRTILVAGLLAGSSLMFLPGDSTACSPCLRRESGERWTLEIETWTVDGTSVAAPVPADGGYLVENPYLGLGDGSPDSRIRVLLADPRTSGATRELILERIVP
jgi:hypothetical protein